MKKVFSIAQGCESASVRRVPSLDRMGEGSGLGTTAMIFGILSLLCCGWPAGIVALICALVERGRDGECSGNGKVGLILGIISIVLGVLSAIFSATITALFSSWFDQEEIINSIKEMVSVFFAGTGTV